MKERKDFLCARACALGALVWFLYILCNVLHPLLFYLCVSMQALLDNDFDYSSEEESGPSMRTMSRQRESRRDSIHK